MYESPIEFIQTQMQMQMDGEILKAVQGVGIGVDKEELIKALAYDREQYVKGYKDGYRDGAKELAEKLKAKAYLDNGLNGFLRSMVIDVNDLDNLLAEMEGEENA